MLMSIESLCFTLVLVSILLPILIFIKLNFSNSNMFKENFNNVKKENNLSKIDIGAVIFLLVCFLLYAVNLYIPLEYRHSDSVGYLNSVIKPVLYSGRFFPLGHQEFNYITLNRFGFLGLFSIPFIQAMISIFVLYKIIPFKRLNLKLIMIVPIFISALSISYSNLIIPERNQLFFLLLFVYFSFFSNESWKIKLGLFFASVSLYYKEPTVAIYLAFAISLILLKFIRGDVKLKELCNIKLSHKNFAIELYLIIISVLFLVSYIIILNLQDAKELYGQDVSLIDYIKFQLTFDSILNYPFLVMSLALAIVFCFRGLKTAYMERAFVLFCGANAYAFGVFALKMPTSLYYFNAANLLILLSFCFAIEGPVGSKKSVIISKIILFFVFIFFAFQTGMISINDLIQSKSKQVRLGEISSYLGEINEEKRLDVYYELKGGNYQDYDSSVMSLYLRTKISNEFTLYTNSGCYVWHESNENGFYECKKKQFDIKDDYDFIISNNSVSKLKLEKKYQRYDESLVKSDDVSIYFRNGSNR